MGCDESELRERIAIADQPENIIIAKSDHRTKTVMRTADGREHHRHHQRRRVRRGDHRSVRRDASRATRTPIRELKWAAVLWREIARRTNCAVLLVHHTRKYASTGAGDMDAARGAGALVGVARVVSTVFTMTEPEAQAFEIDGEQAPPVSALR